MNNPQLSFEIIENYHLPYSVGQGEKTRLKQRIYMFNGGAFPVECIIDIASQAEALTVGTYGLLPNVFKVGKYGSPEINNWEFRNNLVKISSQQASK
jgi:hypothetical protein